MAAWSTPRPQSKTAYRQGKIVEDDEDFLRLDFVELRNGEQ
jgi:hypothetical protein